MAPSKICISRLTKEHKDLVKQPLDGIHAVPDPKCITEWHFLLQGAPDTDYEGGLYYGKLLFPDTYPQAGPAVRMLTPSGRFDPGKDICMSMTNFHPESWNPMWRVSSILAGLQSFMVEEVITTGGVRATSQERRRFALGSIEYNKRFNKLKTLFPEVIAAAESAAASVASAGARAPDAGLRRRRGATTDDDDGIEPDSAARAARAAQTGPGTTATLCVIAAVIIVLGVAVAFT